jgi:hypothetical protein
MASVTRPELVAAVRPARPPPAPRGRRPPARPVAQAGGHRGEHHHRVHGVLEAGHAGDPARHGPAVVEQAAARLVPLGPVGPHDGPAGAGGGGPVDAAELVVDGVLAQLVELGAAAPTGGPSAGRPRGCGPGRCAAPPPPRERNGGCTRSTPGPRGPVLAGHQPERPLAPAPRARWARSGPGGSAEGGAGADARRRPAPQPGPAVPGRSDGASSSASATPHRRSSRVADPTAPAGRRPRVSTAGSSRSIRSVPARGASNQSASASTTSTPFTTARRQHHPGTRRRPPRGQRRRRSGEAGGGDGHGGLSGARGRWRGCRRARRRRDALELELGAQLHAVAQHVGLATAFTSSGVTKVRPDSHAHAFAACSSIVAPRGDTPS